MWSRFFECLAWKHKHCISGWKIIIIIKFKFFIVHQLNQLKLRKLTNYMLSRFNPTKIMHFPYCLHFMTFKIVFSTHSSMLLDNLKRFNQFTRSFKNWNVNIYFCKFANFAARLKKNIKIDTPLSSTQLSTAHIGKLRIRPGISFARIWLLVRPYQSTFTF